MTSEVFALERPYFIGIDTVSVRRFKHWHLYSRTQLTRIFSEQEIEYCLSNNKQSAPRFAVRFALKEAFLKALSNAFPDQRFLLLTICKYTSVIKRDNGSADLHVQWQALMPGTAHLHTSISLTHTHEIATAIVLLSDFAHMFAHLPVIRKV